MLFPMNIALCLTKSSDIVYMFRLTNIQAYEVKKFRHWLIGSVYISRMC
jgi:hypothetical protein